VEGKGKGGKRGSDGERRRGREGKRKAVEGREREGEEEGLLHWIWGNRRPSVQ